MNEKKEVPNYPNISSLHEEKTGRKKKPQEFYFGNEEKMHENICNYRSLHFSFDTASRFLIISVYIFMLKEFIKNNSEKELKLQFFNYNTSVTVTQPPR